MATAPVPVSPPSTVTLYVAFEYPADLVMGIVSPPTGKVWSASAKALVAPGTAADEFVPLTRLKASPMLTNLSLGAVPGLPPVHADGELFVILRTADGTPVGVPQPVPADRPAAATATINLVLSVPR